MKTKAYPTNQWPQAAPSDVGFIAEKLEAAHQWLEHRVQEAAYQDQGYRVVIARGGYLVRAWTHGVSANAQLRIASAAKSVYSSMLGIAVAEGVIPSADAHVVDYYPDMMNIPPGTGPKEGRYAFDKDQAITFRQLISNTSGYMKPGEKPGTVFHYQTYGMNILCHAIASAYGYYNSQDPSRLPGFGKLIEEKIRDPIGGTWSWDYTNFDLWPQARLNIFGNYTQLRMTALDMARLGLLWLRKGQWDNQSIIPADWLQQATQVAPDIRQHCPKAQWKYGHGFWTNEFGLLWPDLPTDTFAASGAGHHHIWVCPSLDLVVVQSPGLYQDQSENNDGILRLIVASMAV